MANCRRFSHVPTTAAQVCNSARQCAWSIPTTSVPRSLGPDGGGMKLVSGAQLVQVINSEAVRAGAMPGECEGNEVPIQVTSIRRSLEACGF